MRSGSAYLYLHLILLQHVSVPIGVQRSRHAALGYVKAPICLEQCGILLLSHIELIASAHALSSIGLIAYLPYAEHKFS